MNISRIDLNLLKTFDALLKMRHVTRAGELVGLSQPAMSYSLSKLREMFEDPLFVRTGRGMEPTPRAEALGEPVARMLKLIANEILPVPMFDPLTSSRTFVLCMSDIGEMVFLPRLLKYLDAHAPHVQIEAVALSTPELEQGLASGAVDIAIGHFPDLQGASIKRKALYRHSYVCVARQNHATIGDSLSLEQYLSAAHAVVRSENRKHDIVERTQERLGIRIYVRLIVPRFMGIPFIIASSDTIATVPLAVGRTFAEFVPVKLLPLPFPVPNYDLHIHWHPRFHHEPGNGWLRDAMSTLIKVPPPPGPR